MIGDLHRQIMDLLLARMRPYASVFEWGSGNSTIQFAETGAHVVSVEHDAQWFDQTAHRIEAGGHKNATLLFKPPDLPADEYTSADHPGLSFASYVRAIEDYDHFAFVIIDGRCRHKCLEIAGDHVLPGGYVVLDDSFRVNYKVAKELYRGWSYEIYGEARPGPQETTIWRKP